MQPNPTLYGQQNNSQKIRFIIVTSIVAIVVLGIAVWAIVAMVSGKNKNNTTAKVDTVAIEDQTDKKQQETEKKSSSITSTTEGVTKTVPAQTTVKEDLPSTGPEEFLPIALVLGFFTTYLGSRKLAKATV
ncbi:hypothetical protein IJ114_01850 [Candidatus Saccharibacteria bacterium]|nr:hypothetical protein [Candidatus Saccharibacteria bacterium]